MRVAPFVILGLLLLVGFTTAAIIPNSDFTANETAVCTYDVIQFTDTSTSAGTISAWWWLFGDSQDSHIQNPTHYYDTVGSYNVSLWVQDEWGENTTVKYGFITVSDCYTGNFAANTTCQIGKPLGIQFTGSCDPTMKSYWWFGDGTTSDSYNPSHEYADYGAYNVTFRCYDIVRGKDTITTRGDYIRVGVNGTFCTAGICSTGSSYTPRNNIPLILTVFACIMVTAIFMWVYNNRK